MKFIKQYPYISSLLIFSAVMAFIGVYAALVVSVSTRPGLPYKKYAQTVYGRNSTSGGGEIAVHNDNSNDSPSTVIKKVGTAKATYYKQDDNTLTQTEYLLPRKVGSTEFSFVAYFENPGFTLEVPDDISLRMVLLSKDDSYATDRTFKIFLDGQLFFSTDSTLEDSSLEKSTFNISLTQKIPYESFVKVAEAKKVRLQVGKTMIDLKRNELQAFRDLVELVGGETVTEKMTVIVEGQPSHQQETILVPTAKSHD